MKKDAIRSKASFLAYDFPGPILSDQSQLTKECFEVINKTVREDIKKLKEKYKFTRCIVVGVSLASSFGSMIYKDNSDITDIILVAPGESLAREVWQGYRTQHLRKSYEKRGITLEELENSWYDLASENNMPAKDAKIYMYLAGKDKVVPSICKNLINNLEKNSSNPSYKIHPSLGHYLLIFYFLLFPRRFMGNNL